MIRPDLLAASIAWFMLACNAHAQSTNLTQAASDFLRKGPAHALAGCDLWHKRCKEVRLRVIDSGDGESNDVPRHWVRMSATGMLAGITFELPTPDTPGRPNALIGDLEVTTLRWPLLGGLRLGDSRAKLLSALGRPSARDEPCWLYADSPDVVSFCFKHDRLASVRWSLFID